MKTVLRDNGLTIALTTMFLFSAVGMIWSGHTAYNQELRDHGGEAVGVLAYLVSGDFLSALFENWESEFLQMSAYVMLTAILFQRGSAESRDPDDPDRPDDELPRKVRERRPLLSWLYSYSLGIALALLFIASFVLHWWASLAATNEEAASSWRRDPIHRQLSVRRAALVRVLPELAVRVHVDGRSRRAVDLPSAQGFAGIETGRRRQ